MSNLEVILGATAFPCSSGNRHSGRPGHRYTLFAVKPALPQLTTAVEAAAVVVATCQGKKADLGSRPSRTRGGTITA